jgi:hypothetical protein
MPLPDMSQLVSFETLGYYVDNSIKTYTESLISLINIASQSNSVEISTLIFSSGKAFDLKSPINMKLIVNNRIPIFDLILYFNLSDEAKKKIEWKVDESRIAYTEAQINFSVLFIYFMLMTRNKAFPERNEKIPNFLTRFMTTPMTIDDIKRCLSSNNLNFFNHKWIKNIEVNLLVPSIKNRLKQGIAGMRLFTIISDNEPDKEIDSNLRNLINMIKKLVHNGPFWEMHTLFQSTLLSSSSISSNLNNLLLDLYSKEKLNNLIESRSLYKMPIYNQRYSSYKTWGESFFNEFKSKLNFDV